MVNTSTVELNDEQWGEERESAAREFLDMGADEFARRFKAGEFDGEDAPDLLMDVLAFFPELD